MQERRLLILIYIIILTCNGLAAPNGTMDIEMTDESIRSKGSFQGARQIEHGFGNQQQYNPQYDNTGYDDGPQSYNNQGFQGLGGQNGFYNQGYESHINPQQFDQREYQHYNKAPSNGVIQEEVNYGGYQQFQQPEAQNEYQHQELHNQGVQNFNDQILYPQYNEPIDNQNQEQFMFNLGQNGGYDDHGHQHIQVPQQEYHQEDGYNANNPTYLPYNEDIRQGDVEAGAYTPLRVIQPSTSKSFRKTEQIVQPDYQGNSNATFQRIKPYVQKDPSPVYKLPELKDYMGYKNKIYNDEYDGPDLGKRTREQKIERIQDFYQEQNLEPNLIPDDYFVSKIKNVFNATPIRFAIPQKLEAYQEPNLNHNQAFGLNLPKTPNRIYKPNYPKLPYSKQAYMREPSLADLQAKYDTRIKKYCTIADKTQQPRKWNHDIPGFLKHLNFNKETARNSEASCFNRLSKHLSKSGKIKTEVIGKGSFGTAIKLTNLTTKQTMVIKKIENTLTSSNKRYILDKTIDDVKFGRKFGSFFKNQTNNVVNYYDCCVEATQESHKIKYDFYVLMDDYGTDLRKFMRNDNNNVYIANITWKHTVIKKILNAMKKIHTLKVIHRDLKPENIFMPSPFEPFIGDFGLINLLDEAETKVGTPLYMAPEVGKEVYTQKADVYSLGLIAFELLNSQFSIFGANISEIRNYCHEKPAFILLSRDLRKQQLYHGVNLSNENPEKKAYCVNHKLFINSMLSINPEYRPSLDDAISHFSQTESHDIQIYNNAVYAQQALDQKNKQKTRYNNYPSPARYALNQPSPAFNIILNGIKHPLNMNNLFI